ELLYELVPRASVIAVLVQTGSAIAEEQLSDLQQAANALRLRLVVVSVTAMPIWSSPSQKSPLREQARYASPRVHSSPRAVTSSLRSRRNIAFPRCIPGKSMWRPGD